MKTFKFKNTLVHFIMQLKNGVPYLTNTTYNQFYDYRIYGVNSSKPYIKMFGDKIYLEDDMIEELKRLYKEQ